jgi:hypothetical protein
LRKTAAWCGGPPVMLPAGPHIRERGFPHWRYTKYVTAADAIPVAQRPQE